MDEDEDDGGGGNDGARGCCWWVTVARTTVTMALLHRATVAIKLLSGSAQPYQAGGRRLKRPNLSIIIIIINKHWY